MRLTYGPFERIGSQVAIKRTRLQFLFSANARKPEITADLYNTCYPLYQEFLAVQHNVSQRSYDVVGGSPGWNAVISSKESNKLLKTLKDWSENHRLVAEWPIRAAVTAMKAWSSDEEGKSYTEIAKQMRDEINHESSVATVKRGVDEVLDIIGLDVDRRSEVKRGPKLGNTQSSEAKTTRETLGSLGC